MAESSSATLARSPGSALFAEPKSAARAGRRLDAESRLEQLVTFAAARALEQLGGTADQRVVLTLGEWPRQREINQLAVAAPAARKPRQQWRQELGGAGATDRQSRGALDAALVRIERLEQRLGRLLAGDITERRGGTRSQRGLTASVEQGQERRQGALGPSSPEQPHQPQPLGA